MKTICSVKPSDLAWFYDKILVLLARFWPPTFCSMKFNWFEFVHHESGAWWPYHWHCPCRISSFFVQSDFKSWDSSAIEKPHLQFCKRYLQVHNKTSNIACRAELGKFPMIIDINKKILNYLDYLRGKDEDSIVKQALQISIDLHHNRKTSFCSNLWLFL